MKIRYVRTIEPAGEPPENSLIVGKSGVATITGNDVGTVIAYHTGAMYLIPWGNIRYVRLNDDKTLQVAASKVEPQHQAKKGWLKKAA